ncbi:hypothetical protein GOODEAATRI_010917 [Goodea atripinnis]|uniref:Uncharacterized protein n=1 Tax=Goodea atripinnis TaxID=208336 RepID=A0ABV0NJ69_9TELE
MYYLFWELSKCWGRCTFASGVGWLRFGFQFLVLVPDYSQFWIRLEEGLEGLHGFGRRADRSCFRGVVVSPSWGHFGSVGCLPFVGFCVGFLAGRVVVLLD